MARAKHLYGDDNAIKWPPFNPQQKEFITTKVPFVCGGGGYGSGKTTALVFRAIMLSVDSPYFGDMSGNIGLLGRYKEKDLEKTTLIELFKWLPRAWIRRLWKKDGILELVNNSVMHFTHLETYEHLQSYNIGWCGIDQMEQVGEDVFDAIALERIRLKTLNRFDKRGFPVDPPVDLAYQSVFGVCNPRTCWIRPKFVMNEETLDSPDKTTRAKHNPDYKYVSIPTLENTINLPDRYIARQRENKSEREFQRDVMGSWDTFEGQIYEDFSSNIVLPDNRIPRPEWKIYAGIDHGGAGTPGKNYDTNVTAVEFFALEERDNDWPKVHVFDELFLPGSTIEETVDAVDEKLTSFAYLMKNSYDGVSQYIGDRIVPDMWRCDPNMAKLRDKDGDQESIISGYMRHASLKGFSLPLVPGGSNFTERHTRINWMFRKGLIDINPKCRWLVDTLRAYEYGMNEKPKAHQNDHNINAFEYACTAIPLWWAKLDAPLNNETRMSKFIKMHRNDGLTNDPVYGNRFSYAE